MLATMGPGAFNWKYSNFGAPSTTAPGTSITPGASSAEGSWTQIASAANIAFNVYGVLIWLSGGNINSGVDRSTLVDIGTDSAGGTAWQAVISNIICGSSVFSLDGGYWYYFPLFIKAGSAVAARAQCSSGTAGTLRVACQFYGQPSETHELKVGKYSETVGAISSTVGVTFTPGTAGEGAWTSLGTTTKNCWWWQLGVSIANGVITQGQIYYMDLAYGDASNRHMIIENALLYSTGNVEKLSLVQQQGWCDVPAGATLYVRGACSGTPDTGANALAIGIGG